MLGIEFNFPIASLRKELIFKHHIFTGSAKNPNLLRILPPLTIKKQHVDQFFDAIKKELSN
jgi:acetylornithine aminotransferase